MVISFRACGISRGARKLTRTPMLIIIKKKNNCPSFREFSPAFTALRMQRKVRVQ